MLARLQALNELWLSLWQSLPYAMRFSATSQPNRDVDAWVKFYEGARASPATITEAQIAEWVAKYNATRSRVLNTPQARAVPPPARADDLQSPAARAVSQAADAATDAAANVLRPVGQGIGLGVVIIGALWFWSRTSRRRSA
jgi:hypothetical protein